MSVVAFRGETNYSLKEKIRVYIFSILFVLPLFLSIYWGITTEKLMLILGVVFILNLSLNFQYTAYFLLLSLFFSLSASFFHLSILITSILLLSFIFTKPNFKLNNFNNPFSLPLLIYFVCIIPSLFNSIDPFLSLYKGLNLVAMIIVMYTISIAIDSPKKINRILYFYISLVLLNSIYVIYLAAATGKRVFGFPGVFYVDFVGLASIMTIILFIFEKKIFYKALVGSISAILVTGLILTQTRNSWISFGLTFIALIIYLLFFSRISKSQKHKIIFYSGLILFWLVLIYLAAEYINTDISKRATSTTIGKISTEKLESLGNNSLLTRVFIWHTAAMAFFEHPIIGIGFNAFSFSSQLYYKIPKALFYLFVSKSNPHITYLAVLVETGIIGLFGFLVFLYAIFKHAIKSLRLNQTEIDFKRSLLLNWSFIYVFISMCMTDAWLWGQYTVLFGFLLGMSVSNYKLLYQERINS